MNQYQGNRRIIILGDFNLDVDNLCNGIVQLTNHLNNSPFRLHPMQFGFRSNHSTETATCFLLENIRSKLDKGGVVGAVFLDLKKALDTVDYSVPLAKLSSFNFSPEATKKDAVISGK